MEFGSNAVFELCSLESLCRVLLNYKKILIKKKLLLFGTAQPQVLYYTIWSLAWIFFYLTNLKYVPGFGYCLMSMGRYKTPDYSPVKSDESLIWLHVSAICYESPQCQCLYFCCTAFNKNEYLKNAISLNQK